MTRVDLMTKVLDNLDEFRIAVSQAQLDGVKHLTVNEKLFNYLTKGSNDLYITYGAPGVKIYKEGCKEKADALDARTAEQAHNSRD